jgi:hypothetical protein
VPPSVLWMFAVYVDELQPSLHRDLARALQPSRAAWAGMSFILKSGWNAGEVHRHVHAQLARDPPALRADLPVGIVLPGDEERGDLVPDVGFVLEVDQRVEHRRQLRARELHVEIVGETLQVHVGRVHLRVELAARLRRDVARRHRDREDAVLVARVGRVHRVLGEDHGIVVGERHAAGTALHCGARDRIGRRGIHEAVHLARLGDVMVLDRICRRDCIRPCRRKARRCPAGNG